MNYYCLRTVASFRMRRYMGLVARFLQILPAVSHVECLFVSRVGLRGMLPLDRPKPLDKSMVWRFARAHLHVSEGNPRRTKLIFYKYI